MDIWFLRRLGPNIHYYLKKMLLALKYKRYYYDLNKYLLI